MSHMKRFCAFILMSALLTGTLPTANAVGTSASSAILMDAGSGQVLYEQNANEKRLIASITKMMTALVALESGHKLDEVVTISDTWTQIEGSSIYLQAGEQITLEALLYGLMLKSGNDAAVAIAEYCYGDVDTFVSHMNETAQRLGMSNSHFANPNGLNHEAHYSTAYDMALLARACLENEKLAQIVSTRSINIGGRSLANHNKMLWYYPGCIGLKTGYTEKAGRTLVSAAERDGMTLIAVTLNDPNDWADHTSLLNYGFENYVAAPIAEQSSVVARMPVSGGLIPFVTIQAGETTTLLLTKNETVEQSVVWDVSSLQAPVEAGTQVGNICVTRNGQIVAQVPLVTAESVAAVTARSLTLLERIKSHFGFEP